VQFGLGAVLRHSNTPSLRVARFEDEDDDEDENEAPHADRTLEFSAIEGVGGSPGFVFGCFFFKILAFIGMGFAFADADLDFDSMILPVEAKSD
jgi:hypothetical protein